MSAAADAGSAEATGVDAPRLVPVLERFVDDCETPVSAFLKLRDGKPCFLLESAEQGRVGRYSFLGFRPRLELRWSDGTLTIDDGSNREQRPEPDPYGAAARLIEGFRLAGDESLPPFPGGAVGLWGYDLVRTVEDLGPPNPDPVGLPDMALMVCEVMLAFDHLNHELTILRLRLGRRRRSRASRSGDRRRPRGAASAGAVSPEAPGDGRTGSSSRRT